ncbi:MAG: hypothetical protein IIA60_11035 [Candidatus Marinimicrobia bacterium]|nr:hypothetical protein [Candidatus Neomarinimicrobiota bacterium]
MRRSWGDKGLPPLVVADWSFGVDEAGEDLDDCGRGVVDDEVHLVEVQHGGQARILDRHCQVVAASTFGRAFDAEVGPGPLPCSV